MTRHCRASSTLFRSDGKMQLWPSWCRTVVGNEGLWEISEAPVPGESLLKTGIPAMVRRDLEPEPVVGFQFAERWAGSTFLLPFPRKPCKEAQAKLARNRV